MNKKARIKVIVKILRNATKQFEEPVVEQVARSYKPFRVLVSTMLSLRTKDETTTRASRRLFTKADSVPALLKLKPKQIQKLIYPVGFYRTKAKNLLHMAQLLHQKYKGKVPDTLDELVALPGVGRKTANLVLSLSYDKDTICVDTHVHRISNRLALVSSHTPHETELKLMKVLPRKYWKHWNMWLVMWGQNICHPVSPHCSECPLQPYCPQKGVTYSR